MKKMYFAPETEVIEMEQTTCLLAGSDPGLGGGGGGVADAPEMPDLPGMPGMPDMPGTFNDPTWNMLLGN